MLIEAGLLQPGTMLSDLSGRLHARVRADGTLSAANALGQHRGSIHQVGAAVQGAPACNGWTFWHFEQEGARLPIDHLRQQVRAGLELAGRFQPLSVEHVRESNLVLGRHLDRV